MSGSWPNNTDSDKTQEDMPQEERLEAVEALVMEKLKNDLIQEEKLDLEIFKKNSEINIEKMKEQHKEEIMILQSELQKYKEKVNEMEMNLKLCQRMLEEEKLVCNMKLQNARAAAFMDLCNERIKELESLGNILQKLGDPSFSSIALSIKEWKEAQSRASTNWRELTVLYGSIRDRISRGKKIEGYPWFAVSPPAINIGIHNIVETLLQKYMNSCQSSNLYYQPKHNVAYQQNPFYQQQFVNSVMPKPYMGPKNQQFPTAYPNYYLANTHQSTMLTAPYGTIYQTPMVNTFLPMVPFTRPAWPLPTLVLPETVNIGSEKKKKESDNSHQKSPVLLRETMLSVTSEVYPPTLTTSESLTNAQTMKASKLSPVASEASVESTNRNFLSIPSSVQVKDHIEPKPYQIQGKCLRKLITKLQKMFPLKTSDELLHYVMLVRERNNNSLSGIPMIVVLRKVEMIILEMEEIHELP